MNILFFDAIDKATFGGYENWICLTAEQLADRGHTVTIAGRPDSEYLRRAKQLGNKVDIFEISISGDFNPITIQSLKSYLDANRIDGITVNFNKDLRLGGLAARWTGRTRVVWRLGLDITKDNFIHRHLTPKLIDGVIVPSQALKRQVLRSSYMREDDIEVIYNGTVIKEFQRPDQKAAASLREKYAFPESSVVAVTVGRLVDQKGHTYLLEAAPKIVSEHPMVRFLWLGNGPLEQALKARVKELQLESSICFAGMLDDIDLELAGADLMIHPAIEEPFSHAILEGMRAGLPIAASRVGGIPEAVDDSKTGILFESRRPDELAEVVKRLLDQRDMMLKLGLAGQERWRRQFTVDRMVDRVEDYLLQVLGKEKKHESAETA